MVKKSLIGQAKSISSDKLKRESISWLDKLQPSIREQLIELKEAYLKGELDPRWNARLIVEHILEPNNIKLSIGLATFRRWLNAKEY